MKNTTDHIDEHIPHHGIRPRFKITLALSTEEITEKVKNSLRSGPSPCTGKFTVPGYITLIINEQERHYWSPQLSLSMEETEEGCVLRGLYAPRPTVWTMFVFFYAIIGFATMIIGTWGLSNLSIGNSAEILWALPPLLIALLSIYLVAYFGKKMGHDQMVELHEFLEASLETNIDASNQ